MSKPVHEASFRNLTDINSSRGRYAQSGDAIPFAQASYTLRVYDERGRGAAASAGYFNGANSILYFALYSPAAYTPLSQGEYPAQPFVARISTHCTCRLAMCHLFARECVSAPVPPARRGAPDYSGSDPDWRFERVVSMTGPLLEGP